MTTSEIMKAMADAGAPFEAILIAVQALDAKDAEIAARDAERADKRARDAERKRQDRIAGKVHKRRPRTFRGQSKDCPMDPPIEDHNPPVSTNVETIAPPKAKRASPLACPDGVRPKVWDDFTKHRAKRGGLSETALDGIEREAVKAGWTLDAALAEVVTRNWQGFKADWVLTGDKSTGPPGGLVDSILAKRRAIPA